jgi:chaperonin GroES
VLDNRVLVEMNPPETVTKSGLIIPTVAQEKTQEGTALYIGPRVEDIKPGDKLIFDKFAGITIKYKNKEYLIVRETEVIAVI